MRYTQHPSNNRVLGAPKNWDQDHLQCGALPVTDTAVEGLPAIASFWVPDAEELALINAGKPIVLWVIGGGMPPVSLGVVTE